MPPLKSGPYLAMMKMTHTMQRIMMWPASMLAKSRTVRDTGFMRALKTSITAITGRMKTGESGFQSISL